MVVDLLVQVVAGLEELHHFKVVLVRGNNRILDHSSIVQEDLVVVLTETQAHHLCIPLDVVKLVDIDGVSLVVNYIKHPESVSAAPGLALDQIADESYVLLLEVYRFLLALLSAFLDHVFEESRRCPFVRPLSGGVDIPQKVVVKHVRERPMAQIMAEAGDRHVEDVPLIYLQLGLLPLELEHELPGDVRRAYAVLEAVVHGRGEHVVDAAQLLKVAQPLELLGIDDVPATRSF